MADMSFYKDDCDEDFQKALGDDVDAMLEMDPQLSAVERIEKYMQSDNVFNRQMAARSILETLREVTHSEQECAAVLHLMCKQLSSDPEAIVRSELMEQIPHIAMFCQQNRHVFKNAVPVYILPLVVLYLDDGNNQVRKTSQAALLVLLEQDLVEKSDIEEQVVEMIVELAGPESPDDYRTEAVALMSKLAPLLGKDITVKQFLPRFCEMCQDQLFHVKKVCAANFGDFCTVVESENAEKYLLSYFLELCTDRVWGVRKACIECFMTVSKICSSSHSKTELTASFVQLLRDQSRWVRMAAFQALGPVISTFSDTSLTGLTMDEDGFVSYVEPATTKDLSDEKALTSRIADNSGSSPVTAVESVILSPTLTTSKDTTSILQSTTSPPPNICVYSEISELHNINRYSEKSSEPHKKRDRLKIHIDSPVPNRQVRSAISNTAIPFTNDVPNSNVNAAVPVSTDNPVVTAYTADTTRDDSPSFGIVSCDIPDHSDVNMAASAPNHECDIVSYDNNSTLNKLNDGKDSHSVTKQKVCENIENSDILVSDKDNIDVNISCTSDQFLLDSTAVGHSQNTRGLPLSNDNSFDKSIDKIPKLNNKSEPIDKLQTVDVSQHQLHSKTPNQIKDRSNIANEIQTVNESQSVFLDLTADSTAAAVSNKRRSQRILDDNHSNGDGYAVAESPSEHEILASNQSCVRNEILTVDQSPPESEIHTLSESEVLASGESLPAQCEVSLFNESRAQGDSEVEGSFTKLSDKELACSTQDDDVKQSAASGDSAATENSDGKVHIHIDNARSFNTFQFWKQPIPEVGVDMDLVNGMPTNIVIKAKVQDPEHHKVYQTEMDLYVSREGEDREASSPMMVATNDLESPETPVIIQTAEVGKVGVKVHTASVSTVSEFDTAPHIGTTHVFGQKLRTFSASSCSSNSLSFIDDHHCSKDFSAMHDTELSHLQDIIPASLLENYLSMANPSQAEWVDQEISRHCAYSLPAVAFTLGRRNWKCLKRLYEELARDIQWKVRRTLAFSLHGLALILGEDITHEDLVPVFEGFLKDLDEVRIGVLKHLADFLRLLKQPIRQKYVSHLKDLLVTDNVQNWRFRLELTEQLIMLCDMYDGQSIAEHLLPVAQVLFTDKVYLVRHTACDFTATIVKRLVGSPQSASWLQPLVSDLKTNFACSSTWNRRQRYVHLCSALLKHNSMSSNDFAFMFLENLLRLGADTIPNVRITVARIFHLYFSDPTVDEFMSSTNNPYQKLYETTRNALKDDQDRDVTSFFTVPIDLTSSLDDVLV